MYDLENLKIVPEGGHEVVQDYPAGEWRRVQKAEGYRWILVNGEVTFEDGEATGATPGQLLRNREIAETATRARRRRMRPTAARRRWAADAA